MNEETYNKLKTIDPTGGKYINWICKQYKNKQFLLEDSGRVKEDLAMFNLNKHRLDGKDKDINTLTYSTLKMLLADKFGTVELHEDNMVGSDITILYEGPYGKLYSPLTEEASCRLGSGTKWCTAAKNGENMFESYNYDGPLYIWIDSNWNKGALKDMGNRSKKFQFHFYSGQYMDELDSTISDIILGFFITRHPVISLLFQRYVESIKDDMYKISKHIVTVPNCKELLDKYVTTSLENEYAFVNTLDLDRTHRPEVQALIDKYHEYMEIVGIDVDIVKYAYYLKNSDPVFVKKYITGHLNRELEFATIANTSWKNLNIVYGFPMEDEVKILEDSKYAIKYITYMTESIRTDLTKVDIVLRVLVNRIEGLSVKLIYERCPVAAVFYSIYIDKCTSPYLDSMGLSGNKMLDDIYKGNSWTASPYELTIMNINLIYDPIRGIFYYRDNIVPSLRLFSLQDILG